MSDSVVASTRSAIAELLATQRLAVVSTQQNSQPYASLVAFTEIDDLRALLFVTPVSTRKYANLAANPPVAMLINNSINQPVDFHDAMAVTAVGHAEIVGDDERHSLTDIHLVRHPYLEDFARSSSCALIRVHVRAYYLVRRFQTVTELHMTL